MSGATPNNVVENTQRAGKTVARNATLVVIYLVELTIAVFAALALFRAVAAENYWSLGLQIFHLVLLLIGWYIIGRYTREAVRQFVIRGLLWAVLLIIFRSVWQAVKEGDDSEHVSRHSDRDLFLTYLGLGIVDLAIWIEQTYTIVSLLFYRKKGARSTFVRM